MFKNLSSKNNQSCLLILEMIKFSIKELLPNILDSNDTNLEKKLSEVMIIIFKNLKFSKNIEKNLEDKKKLILSYLDSNKLNEFALIIKNFDCNSEDLIYEKKFNTKISLGENSDFNNTDTSTKIEKLEITINKESASSARNFNFINQNVKNLHISLPYNSSNSNLESINSDCIKYSVVNNLNNKLPIVKLGIVITLSSLEIKKLFIDKMNR